MAMEALTPLASTGSLILDLPPSCAQFSPSHPEYLVVGTYNLEKDDRPSGAEHYAPEIVLNSAAPKAQNRNGSLVVIKLDGEELTIVQTVMQPSAVLDLRFHKEMPQCRNLLAVVSSTGTLSMFKFDPLGNAASPLRQLTTSRCDDLGEDVLFLQCNWHPTAAGVIGVTTSTGLARLLQLDKMWEIQSTTDLCIDNSLEAWCIAFSPADCRSDTDEEPISIYCGGDDSVIRYVSCHQHTEVSSPSFTASAPMAIRDHHNAGVTAILPLGIRGQEGGRIVLTGSYDDHLRVFAICDLHEVDGPNYVVLLADVNLGGGVWRLDLVDTQVTGFSKRIRVLASCMYAGARVIDIITSDGQNWKCEVVARFEEHKSMNYASDIAASDHIDSELRVVSTSFYDKLVCLWKWKPLLECGGLFEANCQR